MIEDLRRIAKVVVLMFDQRQVMHIQDYWDPVYIDSLRKEAQGKKQTVGVSYYYKLIDQLRIKGSAETVKWIRDFTDKQEIRNIPADLNYDLRVFDDPGKLEIALRKKALAKNSNQTLSRMIATFDWPYTDGKPAPGGGMWMVSVNTPQGVWSRPWNTQLPVPRGSIRKLSWAEQPQTIDEIGSTFTIQGSDLNIAGVILGPSVRFNGNNIYFDGNECCDRNAINKRTLPTGVKISVVETLINNAVNVLMKRGTEGLYIYACDPILRDELLKASKGLLP